MSYIKLYVKQRLTDENGRLRKVVIRCPERERTAATSDLPVILNALVGVQLTIAEPVNDRFTYTFPFNLR